MAVSVHTDTKQSGFNAADRFESDFISRSVNDVIRGTLH